MTEPLIALGRIGGGYDDAGEGSCRGAREAEEHGFNAASVAKSACQALVGAGIAGGDAQERTIILVLMVR